MKTKTVEIKHIHPEYKEYKSFMYHDVYRASLPVRVVYRNTIYTVLRAERSLPFFQPKNADEYPYHITILNLGSSEIEAGSVVELVYE